MGGTYDAAESDDLGEHVLARAETLAGRVVKRRTGAPVAGARSTVWPRGAAGRGDAEVAPAARTVITGGRRVPLERGASDDNRLTVIARSYGSATIPTWAPGPCRGPSGSSRRHRFRCGPAHRSQDPRGGRAGAVRDRGPGDAVGRGGRDGRFQLMDLPRGRGRSSPKGGTPAWARPSTGPLPQAPGRVLTVVLADAPDASRARPSTPRRARPCRACASTAEDGTRTRTDRTGPDGRYRIRGSSRSGVTVLRADERATRRTSARAVLLTTAETLRVDVPAHPGPATLTGGSWTREAGRWRARWAGSSPPPLAAPAGAPGALRTADRLVFPTTPTAPSRPRGSPPATTRLTIAHPITAETTGGLSYPRVHEDGRRRAAARPDPRRPVRDESAPSGRGDRLGARGSRARAAALGNDAGPATGATSRSVKG